MFKFASTSILFFCVFGIEKFWCFEEEISDLLRGITVPEYSFVGGSATLSCDYNLQRSQLYSLKWYHNRTEFYRYVPTERKRPLSIRPTPYFFVQEVSRTWARVVLKLSRLKAYATGTYRCELIAEHPSFRTESVTAPMTVLRERLFPPVIFGGKDIYDVDDGIELRCQPSSGSTTAPRPALKWYIDGQMVSPKITSGSGSTFSGQNGKDMTSVLRLDAKQAVASGGSIVAECRLVLGKHQEVASKTLRVRMPPPLSSVDGLMSKGDETAVNTSLLVVFFWLLCFEL